MIEAKKLTRTYGNFIAVRDASFTAEKGEVVGLLGPNGAGKTTIMRMLTGYSPPSAGTAIIAGFDVTVDPLDAKAHVGYLPERVPLYPDMTVREYVSYWAEMRGMHNRRQRRARVDEVIETVQLTFKRNKLVRSLSKGMRQRLGLAQALVHNPDVIILDEPTIGIDPAQVIEVRETVRDLGKDHCVLFSTHILTEAEQVCDRLLIINQGRIIAEGTPDALRRQIQSSVGIYVEVSGGDGAAVLQGVPGVLAVQADGAGFQLQITDDGVREAVFDAVTAANLKLLEMRSVSLTLEDIFLQLVGEKVQ
ncbi:MAG: ABC transporter ATP-binding protein [Chloroflexota bacterium]